MAPGRLGSRRRNDVFLQKLEIPVFSIQTWNVTATGMNGSILVTDENGVMVNEDYSMFVVENGGTEMIPVAPVKENGDVENNFSFEDGVTFNSQDAEGTQARYWLHLYCPGLL